MGIVSQTGNLSNAQLALLEAFSHNLEESDIKELRVRLANFFAERLIKQADKTWEEKDWSDSTMDELLNSKNNTDV